jgi:hypothetical protein
VSSCWLDRLHDSDMVLLVQLKCGIVVVDTTLTLNSKSLHAILLP